VLQQLDPAYPAGQELVRRDFEFVLHGAGGHEDEPLNGKVGRRNG
jgi:hypothetical protein